jgi:hypothetical protein
MPPVAPKRQQALRNLRAKLAEEVEGLKLYTQLASTKQQAGLQRVKAGVL